MRLGVMILAVGAVVYGGTKPPQPPQPTNKVETVIIVTPLGDGIYNTQQLKIDKEEFDAMQSSVAQ